ncbi:galactokinase [Malacoplasma iowae]|uniref:galactokinase n=1 Tax=Malacoplasma iowae TaxID=2116 RepID=UPI00022C62F5|nr:galactokinase [Malacoplasma iowae]EGZ30935.1 Galactokinase [Malacoplasma iowae 695]
MNLGENEMDNQIKNNLKNLFEQTYNKKPELYVLSPSRINIIGEHIDYLGGNVFPGNINLYIKAAFCKSDSIQVFSTSFKEDNIRKVDIQDNFKFNKDYSFLNYVLGCYQTLVNHNYKIGGFCLVVDSEIPTSSGLSSSASFGIMVLKEITKLYGYDVPPVELAKIFKEVENNFMNLKNGIMDQFVIANGKKNNFMLLNTSTLDYKNYEFDLKNYNFLVINSKKPRNLIESKYNERVYETTKALEQINKKYDYKNLCSIPITEINNVLNLIDDETLRKRAKYAIEEQERVKQFINNLISNNFQECGKILNNAHLALKNDYEVSCKELDFVNEVGNSIDGVLGIRMTGAGFGGCLIALIDKKSNEIFKKTIIDKYKNEFGYPCEVYEIEVVNGTSCFK